MTPSNKDGSPQRAERRKTQRFATELDIEYRTLTQNPIYGSVMSLDLSRGGLSFISTNPLDKGTTIEFKMSVPGDNLPVFAMGTVAWAEGPKTGVKLTRIGRSDHVRVLEYIYRQWLYSKLSSIDKHTPRSNPRPKSAEAKSDG